ncbi:complexin isoform X1 [Schistocerca serialis cubense]|uniref:complexin isoform X1 n=1 Tax=Schistocerca serialis cubense TaxID=2023355 RepID=UPI00214EB8F5|nr:complexin isoform X1 [Schistocerca serialis cubense]
MSAQPAATPRVRLGPPSAAASEYSCGAPAVVGRAVSSAYCSARACPTCYTGAVGGDDDGDDKEKEEEAERERQEAIREAEERRKEKHRKMEEEREKMRQEIRDKYNIKKKEEVQEIPQEEPNPLMRKKKTPEELAREAEAEEEDDFTSKTELKNTIESQVNEIKSQIESKCVLQ